MRSPSMLSNRPIRLLIGLTLLAACGGGGGGPTAPPGDASASIGGQVVGADANTGSLGPVTPMPGVTVRVTGTELTAVTDAEGRFALGGVPAGNRMLSFEEGAQSAALAVNGVQPAERIELVVALAGSSAQLQSITRTGGGVGTGALDLEKATNGADADLPPGPSIPVGDPVEWSYVVTNTGSVELSRVGVTDDQGEVVTCPQTTLAPGESMTCSAAGVAQPGEYANVGTATGVDPTGATASDSDPSHYTGVGASIDLEKLTNGDDADLPPGPTLIVGDPVDWDYVVLNDGSVDLIDLAVSDDQGVLVTCPQTTLAVGESITCFGSGVVQAGQYANLGTATAVDGERNPVADDDPSHYFGEEEGSSAFTVQIQPKSWNSNWSGSSGTVSAKIQGGDLPSIDPATIVLYEADPAAAIAPTATPGITGNHIRAFFAKAEAFGLLVDPVPGETRTVHVAFVAAGVPVDLSFDVKVVGPGN